MRYGPSKASQAFRKRGRRESWFVRISTWRIAQLLFVSRLLCAAGAASGSVQDLASGNFSEVLSRPGLSFVEFYAPWCGHCKKLVPEWERTAQLCQEADILVAKVDAIAHKSLAQEHEVQSFPTLRLYKGGPKVSVKYEGPRTGDKMAEWAKGKLTEQFVERLGASADEILSWAAKKPVAVVGLLDGIVESSMLYDVLEDVSFALNPKGAGGEVAVGIVESVPPALLQGLGSGNQKLPCVALVRNFDFEEKVLFFHAEQSWKQSFEPLTSWIAKNRVPALIPGSEQTEKFFLQEIDPGNGLVLYFGEDDTLRRDLHELAVSSSKEKRLKWVHLKSDNFGDSLAKSVGMSKTDFPEVAIWEFGETEDDDKVYRLSQQASASTFSRSNVEAFVKHWRQGKLSAEKDPVTAVTSDTFDSIVINNEKDVLVEFYAPWCGHCKALAPEYKLVAQHYAQDDDVEIVKMDATKHKHPSADIKSYPTLKLYAKGKKGTPIDGEFKSTRTKDGILEFIEKNRASKSGKGGKKKETKETKETKEPVKVPTSPTVPVSSASTPRQTGAEGGIWVFDDSMDLETRGQELSEEMIHSLNGYNLVQVGDLGLLLSSDGSTRAVRRFKSLAEVKLPKTEGPLGSLPCPADPSVQSCKAWCQGVARDSQELRATRGGKSCSEQPKSISDQPACTCYDAEYKVQLAMCIAPCKGVAEPKSTGGTCQAGDAKCEAGGGGNPSPRFVLYDTKYGEGFNLQREVYPRAGWVVAQANKALDEKCGSKLDGECSRFILVLPPWCQVVHWWTGPDHVYWRTFFDSKALKGSKVPVIEFDEYMEMVNGQKVDMAVSLETDQLKSQKETLKNGRGKFLGFAKSISDCKTKYAKPLEFQKLPSGDLQIVYAGHCDGAIATKELKCAALDGPWPEGVVDMILTLQPKVQSILLKNYDYLLAPDNDKLDALGLRESMLFAPDLRDTAERFIQNAFKGGKYLSAHCRRTDFLRAREKTTPDVSNIAMKLNEVLAQEGIDQVFIATDAQEDLRSALEKQVKATVVFYDSAHGAIKFDHKGKQAIVETWIAARADFFIGTIESRFTMSIQLERSFLGKPHRSSEQEFCKVYSAGGKPCLAPKYRHTPRRGSHRDQYT